MEITVEKFDIGTAVLLMLCVMGVSDSLTLILNERPDESLTLPDQTPD